MGIRQQLFVCVCGIIGMSLGWIVEERFVLFSNSVMGAIPEYGLIPGLIVGSLGGIVASHFLWGDGPRK